MNITNEELTSLYKWAVFKYPSLPAEEVKSAIKEELQDMLNEAVKAASTPTKQTQTTYSPVTQKDISKTWSTGKINQGTVPLEEMINQTKSEMTNEDYKTIINEDDSERAGRSH